MRKISILFLVIFFAFFLVDYAQAKVLPQAAKSVSKQTVSRSPAGISVSPKIRSDRRALVVTFGNLQNARSVSYLLVYNTSAQQEGAGGALALTGSATATQELLFGTCSKNVCRYHTGIKDARLEVTYTTKAGKKYLKKYKIKV